MANDGSKYFIYRILDKIKLEDVAKKLKASNFIRQRQYFDGEESKKLELRSRFPKIEIEDKLLSGSSTFEVSVNLTDIDGKYSVEREAHTIDFFVNLEPVPHLTVKCEAKLGHEFSKIVNGILFPEERKVIKVKLTPTQILNFLNNNPCIIKGEFVGTSIAGVSTIGIFGSNIDKSPEITMIRKHLTDRKAVKPMLEEYGWTLWISSRTGMLYCLDSHLVTEFLEFIEEKIIPLCV